MYTPNCKRKSRFFLRIASLYPQIGKYKLRIVSKKNLNDLI